jgi:hypothetical protein
MWPSMVKIRYTELKLLCGNLCGRPPAIPNHIIQLVSRRAYKNVVSFYMNNIITSNKSLIWTVTHKVWFGLFWGKNMCIHHTQDEGHNSRQREFEVFVQTPPPNLFALSKVTDEGCYRNVLWILNYRYLHFYTTLLWNEQDKIDIFYLILSTYNS